MFTVICFFRVDHSNLDAFLKAVKKSGELLKSHGALEHTIYYPNEITGKQGSMGMLNLFELEDNEELIFGQTIFESEEHYYEVMKAIGYDDIIQHLDNDIRNIVEMTRVVTSKFSTEAARKTEGSL